MSRSTRGSLVFDPFNPQFVKPVTVCIVAPRGSGKSVLLSDLLTRNKDFFDDVHVFAGSESVVDDYKDRLPAKRLYKSYEDDTMVHITRCSKNITKTVNTFNKLNPNKERPRFNIAIVLDDLGFDTKIFKSVNHMEIWLNGRHASLSIFLCLQYVASVPPVIRAQADIVIALRESIKANQKRLHECFFGIFETFSQFQGALIKSTENFGALVVNNRSRSGLLTQCVFTYKAAEREYTRLCCPMVWKMNKASKLLKLYSQLKQRQKEQEVKAQAHGETGTSAPAQSPPLPGETGGQ
jgi:hypothetical protein